MVLKKMKTFKEILQEKVKIRIQKRKGTGYTGSRITSFRSSEPGTYDFYVGDKIVGNMIQMKDPEYNLKTTAWFLTFDDTIIKSNYIGKFQSFQKAKKYVIDFLSKQKYENI